MHRLLIFLFLGSFIRLTWSLSSHATCYFPDGAVATGNYPCFLDQSDSPCCGGGSICEASGLCKVPRSIGVSELIRGACTDSTWTSSSCPHYCTDADTGGTNIISCQNVTKSDLDFCCDHTNGCCDSGIGRFQVPLNTDVLTLGSSGATIATATTATFTPADSSLATPSPGNTSTSSSSYLTSSGPPSTTTSSATNTAGADSSSSTSTITPIDSSNLSAGAKAGIAIGCVIGGLAVVGGIVYFCLRKLRRSNTPPELAETGIVETGFAQTEGISRLQELEGRPARRISGYKRVELPA